MRNISHVCTDTVKHFDSRFHIQKFVSTQQLNLMKVVTVVRLHDYFWVSGWSQLFFFYILRVCTVGVQI